MKSTIIAATLAILVLGGCSSPPDAPTADNSEVTSTGCQPLTDDQLNIIQSGVIPAAADAISLTRGAWLPLPAEYGALGHTKITVVEMKFVDDTETAEATLAANDDLR